MKVKFKIILLCDENLWKRRRETATSFPGLFPSLGGRPPREGKSPGNEVGETGDSRAVTSIKERFKRSGQTIATSSNIVGRCYTVLNEVAKRLQYHPTLLDDVTQC